MSSRTPPPFVVREGQRRRPDAWPDEGPRGPRQAARPFNFGQPEVLRPLEAAAQQARDLQVRVARWQLRQLWRTCETCERSLPMALFLWRDPELREEVGLSSCASCRNGARARAVGAERRAERLANIEARRSLAETARVAPPEGCAGCGSPLRDEDVARNRANIAAGGVPFNCGCGRGAAS